MHVWESRKRRGKRAEQLHAQIGDLLIGWEETLSQSANFSQLTAAGSFFFFHPARISSCSRQTPFRANCLCSFVRFVLLKPIRQPHPPRRIAGRIKRPQKKNPRQPSLFSPNLPLASFKGRSQRFQISRTSFPCLQPCVCVYVRVPVDPSTSCVRPCYEADEFELIKVH